MGDSFDDTGSRNNSVVTSNITNKKACKNSLVASSLRSFSQKSARHIVSVNHGRMGRDAAGDAAFFLLKVAALEAVRRFSTAKCPFVWCGMQALQVLCYPPFKWIQRWAPFKVLVNGMQTLSRPLLVLCIATALSDQSGGNATSDSMIDSQGLNGSHESSESHSELSPMQSTLDTRVLNESPQSQSSTNWLCQLYAELEKQGITLPERITEDELHRFYIAASGDFPCLLSSVKKTIRWRETCHILSGQELERWSNIVFWHGFDVQNRPCLVVRLGLGCISLSFDERPLFVQAVVSQVEHGILHLVDTENPLITVLVDCEGLSPFRFPMQMLRSCSAILQEHFPNRLGFVFVIRVPPVVRVLAQSFIQVFKPVTRQKFKFAGKLYQKILMENFHTPPAYLGGSCTCLRCSNLNIPNARLPRISASNNDETKMDINRTEDSSSGHPRNLTTMHTDGNSVHVLTAVVSIITVWVLIAVIAGLYDPEG